MDTLLGVAAFLRAEYQHFPAAAQPRHAADHRGIVAEAAVAVNLAEVGKDALNVVERVGPVRMARQLGALPRGQFAGHLALERLDALMQHHQLLLRLLIVAGGGMQLLNLFFNSLEFFLRFGSSFHIGVILFRRRLIHRLRRIDPEVQGGQHSGLRRRKLGLLSHDSSVREKHVLHHGGTEDTESRSKV